MRGDRRPDDQLEHIGADGNNAGLWIELDGILAVVIGGTSLSGGRFHLGGTVLGALVIQTLNNTLYTIGVPTQTNLVFKAAVVIIVCLLQSPVFRAQVRGLAAEVPVGVATARAASGEPEAPAVVGDPSGPADGPAPLRTPPTTEVSG